MTTTLLLDADIIAFKVSSVSQSTYQFPGCEPSTEVDDWETEVVPRIHEQVSKLTAKLETEKVIVCLSCPTAENWRLKVLPTYKGNRDYSKRPLLLQKVKDYLEANWNKVKTVMVQPSHLDRLTKEIIAVAVSATNACGY